MLERSIKASQQKYRGILEMHTINLLSELISLSPSLSPGRERAPVPPLKLHGKYICSFVLRHVSMGISVKLHKNLRLGRCFHQNPVRLPCWWWITVTPSTEITLVQSSSISYKPQFTCFPSVLLVQAHPHFTSINVNVIYFLMTVMYRCFLCNVKAHLFLQRRVWFYAVLYSCISLKFISHRGNFHFATVNKLFSVYKNVCKGSQS